MPQEVEGLAEVAKEITESGLEMADRPVLTQYDVLRELIGSTAKSVSTHNGAKPGAAEYVIVHMTAGAPERHWSSAPAALWGAWLAGHLHALATGASAKKRGS